jgi:hypothetical protein
LLPGTRSGTGHDCHLPRASGSSQIVHSLGGGERSRAPRTISLRIEPLGACQSGCERRLCLLLGLSDRGRRRLAIELGANRLRRHRPGVWVSRGLAHGLLELRDPAAARTGMRRRDAEAQGDGNQQGCRNSADCWSVHFQSISMTCSIERRRDFRGPPIFPCRRVPLRTAYGGARHYTSRSEPTKD